MTSSEAAPSSWLVAGVPDAGSSGGSVRARHVFSALARRTGARVIGAHGRRGLPALAVAVGSASGGWRRPLHVASTQLLPRRGLGLLRGKAQASVLDVHDHPRLQAEGLGFSLDPTHRDALDRLFEVNAAAFDHLVVPSATFAELCRLPGDQVLVVSNGADTQLVRPAPAPAEPVVGMVSGAAPGRGIELLVEAMQLVRDEEPAATLRLALAATGPASAAYLDSLRSALRDRAPWVGVQAVPYEELGAFLADTSLLVIPHPPNPYLDVATPVKLFDSMAAGRPVVVTPRLETAAIVTATDAGVVANGDRADDLAEAILTLLRDAPRRDRLGASARRAAVAEYDWRVLAGRLADVLLARGPAAMRAGGPGTG
ncbi:MAG TPA: glycosyltransferase [Candidatus Limnocylindria bacterium]|nr:glycosyltransferase [Candidatus Limnocylindria bacterium]